MQGQELGISADLYTLFFFFPQKTDSGRTQVSELSLHLNRLQHPLLLPAPLSQALKRERALGLFKKMGDNICGQ